MMRGPLREIAEALSACSHRRSIPPPTERVMTPHFVNPKTGNLARLVSTKGLDNPELEQVQLMIESLLERAHRSGLNVWHTSDDGPTPVSIGAVWLTSSQYELRFTGAAHIVEPARLRKHTPRGELKDSPTIARPVTDFIEGISEVYAARNGEAGKRHEVFFGSGDARFPSILITLAPQGQRLAQAERNRKAQANLVKR